MDKKEVLSCGKKKTLLDAFLCYSQFYLFMDLIWLLLWLWLWIHIGQNPINCRFEGDKCRNEIFLVGVRTGLEKMTNSQKVGTTHGQ